MKMNEQVLTALEVLRNFAENDFELHRIDVLEKDLTEPPQVEIIDDTHQKFNGVTFKANKDGHLFYPLSLHRAVWFYYYGDIPHNNVYDIHHKDLNPANNDVSNLQLLTISEHRKLHNEMVDYAQYTCEVCGKNFASRKINNDVHFCSRRCYGKWVHHKNIETRKCVICGKDFQTSKYRHTQTCSYSCRAKLGAQSTKESYQKVCKVCGKTFVTNDAYRKCCSPDCSKKAKIKPEAEIVCPVCGKTFKQNQKHPDHICCSKSCGLKLSWQKRKSKN